GVGLGLAGPAGVGGLDEGPRGAGGLDDVVGGAVAVAGDLDELHLGSRGEDVGGDVLPAPVHTVLEVPGLGPAGAGEADDARAAVVLASVAPDEGAGLKGIADAEPVSSLAIDAEDLADPGLGDRVIV